MSMLYIESPSIDPAFNLALEQYIFDSLDKSNIYFMLWQNDNAIIVGKNQNTIEGINSDYIKEHHIKVIRRLSGGGTVYHDLGNLNYTFVVDAEQPSVMDLKKFGHIVAQALNQIGILAVVSGRNDILINGRKFSGNAQYVKDGRIMHHGTLMFDSNLSVLSNALKVSQSKIVSKGVKSIKSSVTNIYKHLPIPMTLAEFKGHLLSCLFTDAGISSYSLTPEDIRAVTELKQKVYDTWEWNYGYSTQYEIRKKRRFEGCGELQLSMNVSEGIIRDLIVYGDYFGLQDSSDLSSLLTGIKVCEEDLRFALNNTDVGQYFSGMNTTEFINFLIS